MELNLSSLVMKFPKISVVTPSYNQGEYLEDTIKSVLGQFYPNLEYFVFDGGSTDNTIEILNAYGDKITYWESKKDAGQADAINRGFQMSTGEILLWLNSDDCLMPNVLNYIAESYTKYGKGIYFGNCIHFRENESAGIYASGSNVIQRFQTIDLELADTIIQPASFWSRDVWGEIGPLDSSLHYGFDWEWFLRAKRKSISFHPFNKPIALYRFHEKHKTANGGNKRQRELLIIYQSNNKKYAQLFLQLSKEDFAFSWLIMFIYKIIKFIMGKPFSKVHFIKLLKWRKYFNYTVEEINACRSML